MPFFSIIIPVYNQEKYIDECISSVMQQTYKNYEIILIDDGSSDSSSEICDRYELQNRYTIKVIHKKNEGVFRARVTGINYMNGKYAVFLDSDDQIKNNTLEILYNKCINYNYPDMLFFNVSNKADYTNSVLDYSWKSEKYFQDNDKADLLVEMSLSHTFNNLCSKCIKKNVFIIDPIEHDKIITYGEDLYQLIPIFNRAETFLYVNETLYYYRQHSQSATHFYNDTHFYSIKTLAERYFFYASIWSKNYHRNYEDNVRNYIGVELYRILKNIVKTSEFTIKEQRKKIRDIINSDFYKTYKCVYKENCNLKKYEKIINHMLVSNKYLEIYLLRNIFCVVDKVR